VRINLAFVIAAAVAVGTAIGGVAIAQEKAPAGTKSRAKSAAPATATDPSAAQGKRGGGYDWVVGIAAGRIEGAPLRLAAELAQIADDGDNLRVMPIVTRGVFDNITDMLYLRGVDGAIVYGDVLEHFKSRQRIPNIERKLAYVANLSVAEMHVLARPGINSLKDLAGKRVNFNTSGTAAAFTGPIVFERLGIDVIKQFEPHREVMAAMTANDDVAAVVFVTTKPVPPIAQPAWPQGFRLLPVEYSRALEEFYLPAYLDHAEYPKLIPAGQKVATIAVPVILAVFNAGAETDRHRRLSRFVDRFFERLPQLQKAPYDPSWKSVNLAAAVPGWKRFGPMQQKLDRIAAQAPPTRTTTSSTSTPPPPIDVALARQQAAKAAPNDPAEQERLFQKFIEWNRTQGR
jgi:TRAP-type uncharacterized transport system substrate-binding protein